ncbi:hypothetical protein FSY59_21605 [Comamonas sp. Z3]|nr:hypothetical protein FSY59_21605 [Comamonas sp. Z3]
MRQQLVFARRHGLEGARGRFHYLLLVLMAEARFEKLPGAVELLARVKAGSLGGLRLTEASCRSRLLRSEVPLALYG